MKLTKEMIDWFGDGEVDVPLMVEMGAITEDTIIKMYNRACGLV